MDNKQIAVSVVSQVTRVPKSVILSHTRIWPAVEARQLIILLLYRDGATDESIAWMINRCRSTVLKSRHSALDSLRFSKPFRDKLSKASELYEAQKSLRIS